MRAGKESLSPDPEATLRHFLSEAQGIDDDSKLLLLFSGGIDSSVLLYLLHRICKPNRLHALHIDYQLRGEESKREVEGIQLLCRKKNIPLHQYSYSLSHLKKGGGNLQGRAREFRYRKAGEVAEREGCDGILTAHHLDDYLETFFSKLIKGQSPAALSNGWDNPLPIKGVPLLRPLASLPKKSLEAYARRHSISFFIDSSNREDHYERNYLRNRVFPLLDEKFSGWRENTLHTVRLLESVNRLWGKALTPWVVGLPPVCVGKSLPGFVLLPGFWKLPREEGEILLHNGLYRYFPERRFSRNEIWAIGDKMIGTGAGDKRLFPWKVGDVIYSRGWVAPPMFFTEGEEADLHLEWVFRKNSKRGTILFAVEIGLGMEGETLSGKIILHPLNPPVSTHRVTVVLPETAIPSHGKSGKKTLSWEIRPLSSYSRSLRVGRKTLKKHIEAGKYPAPVRSSLLGVSCNKMLLGALDLWGYGKSHWLGWADDSPDHGLSDPEAHGK